MRRTHSLRFLVSSRIAGLLLCAMGAIFTAGCSTDAFDELAIRDANAAQDRALYDAGKPKSFDNLTLEQAVALSRQYNLDLWLARQEEAIRRETKTASFLKMLPSLTFDVNSETRDSYNASSSLGLFSGQEAQLDTYSYSSEKNHTYGGMKLLWNAVDFGVSYFRAKQDMNRQKQAGQEKRRIAQKLACDVATAYWQCVSYERVARRATALREQFDRELENLQESAKTAAVATTEVLERSYLLKTQRVKISEFLEKQQAARLNLLQLMGLPVDATFTLADAAEPVGTQLPAAGYNIDALENAALRQRPEFFQEDLSEKISRDEARAALLGMLPSPSLFINPQADSNKYLYYNSWFTAGVNVSWNLFNIPGKAFEAKSGMKQLEFARKKRLALAVAVITQVRLAVIEHDFALERYHLLQDLNADSQKIADNLEQSAKAGKAKANAAVSQLARGLDDYAKYQDACARVMIARARILQSIGNDPGDTATATATGFPAAAYATTNGPRIFDLKAQTRAAVDPLPAQQPASLSSTEALAADSTGIVYIVGEDGRLIPKQSEGGYIELPATSIPASNTTNSADSVNPSAAPTVAPSAPVAPAAPAAPSAQAPMGDMPEESVSVAHKAAHP